MYLDKLRYGSNKERKKLFDEINNRFLELLYKYGIDKEETITLTNLR